MCGILKNETCKELFEEINRQPCCEVCRDKRKKFAKHDKKYNEHYSNLLPGFSSEKIAIPLDILIVAEAHSGAGKESFREQKGLEEEIDEFAKYYLPENIETFHQQQMRVLLKHLNEEGRVWIFTDLIKCFVWHGKKNELKGSENKNEAINHCRGYLNDQIKVLQPKIVISLGKTVYYTLCKDSKSEFKHGGSSNNSEYTLISSYFPSRMTADLWVKNKDWGPIKETLKNVPG